jgi:aerobic C4-dicarboxylate transport protein
MSVGRAMTNFIGNAVATVAISRWEGELSRETLRKRLTTGLASRGY